MIEFESCDALAGAELTNTGALSMAPLLRSAQLLVSSMMSPKPLPQKLFAKNTGLSPTGPVFGHACPAPCGPHGLMNVPPTSTLKWNAAPAPFQSLPALIAFESQLRVPLKSATPGFPRKVRSVVPPWVQ